MKLGALTNLHSRPISSDKYTFMCQYKFTVGDGDRCRYRADWKRLISYVRKRDVRECRSCLVAANLWPSLEIAIKKIGEGRVMRFLCIDVGLGAGADARCSVRGVTCAVVI